MVNLYKIIGYNLTYAGPNLIDATPYEINSSISQYEEVILEATVDKASLPGPVTVLVNLTLPNGNEYENIYMLGEVDQPNKYRLRLNDVIGNELAVGEQTELNIRFKVRTQTDVFITNTNISFELYKTNLDVSYHPTDIDSLFIGLNKLSMNITDVDGKVQNYIDIANDYTDEKVANVKDSLDLKLSSLNVYTRVEANAKFQSKVDHDADIENLRADSEARYETKSDALQKLSDAKKYAQELVLDIGSNNTGNFEGDLVLSQSKIYTDQKISDLINHAPETLDTFKEIADYIASDKTATQSLLSAVNNKADKTELDAKINKNEVYTRGDADSLFVAKVSGKGLSTNDYTNQEKAKLESLKNYDDTGIRNRVAALENSDFVAHSEVYTKTQSDNKYAVKDDITTLSSKFNNYYDKAAINTELNKKQNTLTSGQNIKTINGVSILGSGNIVIEGGSGGSVDLSGYATESYVDRKIEELTELDADTLQSIRELSEELSANQEVIDALNNAISLKADKTEVYTKSDVNSLLNAKVDTGTVYTKVEVGDLLSAKQNLLESGVNIKTINGESILGPGNIDSVNEVRVNELINSAVGSIDLSPYATKAESDDKYFEKKDIKEYAKTSYVDDAITNLVGAAPETLDTLQELATAIQTNQSTIEAIESISTTKADKADTYTKSEVDVLIENVDVSEELSNYYTKSETDIAIQSHVPDLTGYAKETWVEGKLPKKVSELDNDVNYINSIKTVNNMSLIGSGNIEIRADVSSLETKADAAQKLVDAKKYTDNEIAKVINSAPAEFDTLKEIADYISSDKSGASNMLASIQQNKSSIATVSSNLSTETATRKSEDAAIRATISEVSTSTSQSIASIQTALNNRYTKSEAEAKFLDYSETISKSESIVDYANPNRNIKLSSDEEDVEYVISKTDTDLLAAMLATMVPNEY